MSLGTDPVTGRRIRKTVYGDTQTDVRKKLELLKADRPQTRRAALSRDSVTAYLQRWLDDDVRVNTSPRTHQEYAYVVKRYVEPFIGSIPLTDIQPVHIQSWLAELERSGFSDDMRYRGMTVLRNALNGAIRLKLITENPCNAIKTPKPDRRERQILTVEACLQLLPACEPHRLGDMIALCVMTGLRKRELFGLEWNDIDLHEGVLTVRRSLVELHDGKIRAKEPKTKAGRRVVMLGDHAIAALKSRLSKALAEDMGPEVVPIVFPDIDGGWLRGSIFDRWCWHPIRKSAGIPDSITFHDLRHTAASLMISSGVDIKTIQKRLGHAKASTTLDVYAHLLPDSQATAVARVDELFAAAESESGGYTAGYTDEGGTGQRAENREKHNTPDRIRKIPKTQRKATISAMGMHQSLHSAAVGTKSGC